MVLAFQHANHHQLVSYFLVPSCPPGSQLQESCFLGYQLFHLVVGKHRSQLLTLASAAAYYV
jgi:hypothetical protein